MAQQDIPIYLSVGRAHLPLQRQFVETVKSQLRELGMEPRTLGDTQYSYLSPLDAIRREMVGCHGAAILGLERTHCLIGYDRQGSSQEVEFTHRRLATVWCHLEAGMAYQAGLPLLILRENTLCVEGILDPAISGYFVFSFSLAEMAEHIPNDMKELISSWAEAVRKRFVGKATAWVENPIEAFLDLTPAQSQDPRMIEASLSAGLRRLKPLSRRLPADAKLEVANFEARLISLLQDGRLFGPNETVRSETSRVIYELNRLCLAHFNRTFTDLCIG